MTSAFGGQHSIQLSYGRLARIIRAATVTGKPLSINYNCMFSRALLECAAFFDCHFGGSHVEHHTTDDRQLVVTMSLVMGALVIFFFAIVIVANLIVEPDNTSPNKVQLAAMTERTEPVGQVRTSLEGAEGGAAAPADAGPKTGKQLVESACLACHGAATAAALNAPAIGDAAAWESRLAGGLDALISNAINGINAMPARGGSSYSDDEMRLAVEYLVGQ